MSSSKTARLFGIARGLKGGATNYEKSPSDYNAKMKYLSASIMGMPLKTELFWHFSFNLKNYPSNIQTFFSGNLTQVAN